MTIQLFDKNNQQISIQQPISLNTPDKANAFAWAINKFLNNLEQNDHIKKTQFSAAPHLWFFHIYNFQSLKHFFSDKEMTSFATILRDTVTKHPYPQNSIENIIVMFVNAVGTSKLIVGLEGITSPVKNPSNTQTVTNFWSDTLISTISNVSSTISQLITQNPTPTLDQIIDKHNLRDSNPNQFLYNIHSFIRDLANEDVTDFQSWLTKNINNPANIQKVIGFFIQSIQSLHQHTMSPRIFVDANDLKIFEQTVQTLQSQTNPELLRMAEQLNFHIQAYKESAKNYSQNLIKTQNINFTTLIQDLATGFEKFKLITDPEDKIIAICCIPYELRPQYWASNHENCGTVARFNTLEEILNSNKVLHSTYALRGFAEQITNLHQELKKDRNLTECSHLIQEISTNTCYQIYENQPPYNTSQTSIMEKLIEHFAPELKQELLTPRTSTVKKRINMGCHI